MKPVLKSFLAMLAISVVLIGAYVLWLTSNGTTIAEIVAYLRHGSTGVMIIVGIIVCFLIGWAMLSWNFRVFAEQEEMRRIAEEKRRAREEESADKADSEQKS